MRSIALVWALVSVGCGSSKPARAREDTAPATTLPSPTSPGPAGSESYGTPSLPTDTRGVETGAADTARSDTAAIDSGASWSSTTGSVLRMVRVPAGRVLQGCTPSQADHCRGDELPSEVIEITRDFLLSRTEVTQAEYEAVMGQNPSAVVGPDLPVHQVSWPMAADFANRLSEREGLETCYTCRGRGLEVECERRGLPSLYSCGGYRLPSEAEWEHAARCTTDLLYAGSEVADEVGWHRGNAGDTPHPVAQLAPNDCGLYDMTGNVFEWTNDWADYYAYVVRSSVDPEGPGSGVSRIYRGGGFDTDAVYGRVAIRFVGSEIMRTRSNGIRLARTAP